MFYLVFSLIVLHARPMPKLALIIVLVLAIFWRNLILVIHRCQNRKNDLFVRWVRPETIQILVRPPSKLIYGHDEEYCRVHVVSRIIRSRSRSYHKSHHVYDSSLAILE